MKLGLISKRLTGLTQQSALEIEQLMAAQVKLSAVIATTQKKAKSPVRKPVPAARKEVLTAAGFIRAFREGLVAAMDSGKDVWQVVDDMEESAARSERFRALQDSGTES